MEGRWIVLLATQHGESEKNFSLFFSEKKEQVDCQNEHLRIDAGWAKI